MGQLRIDWETAAVGPSELAERPMQACSVRILTVAELHFPELVRLVSALHVNILQPIGTRSSGELRWLLEML